MWYGPQEYNTYGLGKAILSVLKKVCFQYTTNCRVVRYLGARWTDPEELRGCNPSIPPPPQINIKYILYGNMLPQPHKSSHVRRWFFSPLIELRETYNVRQINRLILYTNEET